MENEVLNCFYNVVVPGASSGVVDTVEGVCYISFSTKIPSINKSYIYESDKYYAPTLYIKNKEEFDKYLVLYYEKAKEYYKRYNYNMDIILSMLFVDASSEDFLDPVSYLKKKIGFLEDKTIPDSYEVLGYSDIFNGEIVMRISKSSIFDDGPHNIIFELHSSSGSYVFPTISYGIYNGKAYIYSIQKVHTNLSETIYQKKVKRTLYKIGEGFDSKKDNYDIYDYGNLKDVSASFVVCACLFLSLLNKNNINDIILPSIRIVRWNNKEIVYDLKSKSEEDRIKYDSIHQMDQSNITEKFLRTFMRLCYHFDGLDVISYPFENDSCMHIHNSGNLECNNSLLGEVYGIISELGVEKNASK